MECLKFMFVIPALFLTVCSAEKYRASKTLELIAHSEFKAILGAFMPHEPLQIKGQHSRLKSFSFKNCADPSQEILVPTNINVTPDPISIPGNITISGILYINSTFGAPLLTNIVVEKEVLGHWIKVPCIDNIGSCTYNDMCSTINVSSCPPQFINAGLPCKCPFPKGTFNIQPFIVAITGGLPFKITGGVRVQISATYQSALVSCAQLELDLA